MEQKKDISLFTKITLVLICVVPIFFIAFDTYSARIDAGDNVNNAFESASIVFIILFFVEFCLASFVFVFAGANSSKDNKWLN